MMGVWRDGDITDTALFLVGMGEELVIAWWATLHRTEREEMAERGLGQIASRWMPDEYAAASAASEAA